MNRQKRYIISLSAVFLGSIMFLQFFNEVYLEKFLALFTLTYLVVTQIFNPRRRWFDVVGVVLVIWFSYLMVVKLLEILPRIIAS